VKVKMPRAEAPHRVIDRLLDSALDALKGFGEGIASALDEPPKAVEGPEGIHRIVDRVLDGIVEGVKTHGEGIARALDHPVEQFGVPPELPEVPRPPRPPRFRRE